MKVFTVVALLCLAASSLGAPQFKSTDNYDSFGLPQTGRHIINVQGQGDSWNFNFGKIPYSGKNFMTREQRAQYLPVMTALLKVMETNRPAVEDVNTLLVLSRDLAKSIPEGGSNILAGFGGGFGLDGIGGMGLAETGDVIKNVSGVPHIITQFGAFPLSDVSLMTDKERREFLPVTKAFINVLQKDNIDADSLNILLDQSRQLTKKLEQSNKNNNGAGFLGGLGGSGGISGLEAIIRGRTASVLGSSSSDLNEFLLPKTGDHIINVAGQGPSFNTAIGKFPIGEHRMTPEERARFLPVMKALLRVMETNKPAPSDVNDLLVLTRNLQKYIPKGTNQFAGFANLEGIDNMGIPETGDVIKIIGGKPHIETTFGAFPLSDVSLMTDAERQQYLPAVRSFINVLEKENLDPDELNTLLAQSRELTNLIPANLMSQFNGGLNGLSGFGK